MKKINKRLLRLTAITIVTLFMSSAVFSQVRESKKDSSVQDTTTQMKDQKQAFPQEQYQRSTGMGDEGVDYSETIEKNELPQEVSSSLKELYPSHEIEEVFRGDDDSFKVKVKKANDVAVVYYSSEGDFLRAENKSGQQQGGALPQEQGQRTMESQGKSQWGTEGDTKSQQSTRMSGQSGQTGNDMTNTRSSGQADRMDNMRSSETRSDDNLFAQDEDEGVNYTESIEKDDLPGEVTSSLKKLYPAHDIEEVHRGDNDSFKVKVTNEDDEAVVYYNSEGEFLRARNLSGLQQEGVLPQEQSQRTGDSQSSSQQGTNQGNLKGTMGTQGENNSGTSGRSNESVRSQEQSQRTMDSDNTRTGTLGSDDKGNLNRTETGRDARSETGDNKSSSDRNFQPTPQGTTGKSGSSSGTATQGDRTRGSASESESTMGQNQRSRDMGQESGDRLKGSTAVPQEQSQAMGDADKDYSEEIEENDLPAILTKSLKELYPDHDIDKAYRADDGSYKVDIEKQDHKVSVFYDSSGYFVRDEKMNIMDKK